ncbi:MAG: HD domain-containing protein [Planctomycetota bacterium]
MCLEPRAPIPPDHSDQDLVVEIVDDLAAALVNARIYRPDHPRVLESAGTVHGFVASLSASDGDTLRLSVAADMLVHRGHPLIGASVTASRLIQALEMRQSGGFEIDRDADTRQIAALLAELAARRGSDGDWRTVNARLELSCCPNVRLLPPFVIGAAPVSRSTPGTVVAPLRFYQSCMDVLQDVTISICHGGRIEFGSVHSHAEAVLRRLESDEGPFLNLSRQDQYDAFTFGHSVRVAVLAMNFARHLTDDHDLLVRIGTAALLHDCGKSLVPFEILHSRKALGPDERREMGKHTSYGAEILLDHDGADPLAIAAAFGHHRSCNGGGYPRAVPRHRNLLATEIVKICDVYEALTAARPYKRPMSPMKAYRVMMSMDVHLDRALLRRFIETNGIYPVGQLVRLESGECARVLAQNGELLLPAVRIETDPVGVVLPEDRRETVDLRTQPFNRRRTIGEALRDAAPAVA